MKRIIEGKISIGKNMPGNSKANTRMGAAANNNCERIRKMIAFLPDINLLFLFGDINTSKLYYLTI